MGGESPHDTGEEMRSLAPTPDGMLGNRTSGGIGGGSSSRSDDRAASVSPLPAGVVTFVMTDIEGSTRLFRELGERYVELLATHQGLLRGPFAVYTHDDDMAEGVVAAIENAGREDEMILTGAGGSCAAFDQIESGGLYAATYLYSPTMAGSAVNMARLIALGQGFSDLVEPEVPSLVVVPPTEVTQDNVNDLRELCFE